MADPNPTPSQGNVLHYGLWERFFPPPTHSLEIFHSLPLVIKREYRETRL